MGRRGKTSREFDDLAVALASGGLSRRSVVKRLGGVLAGALVLGPSEVLAA